MNPRYPLYILSKGRWQHERRLTSRALEAMRVPYRIVVEEQEREEYARVIDPAKILILDPQYQTDYNAEMELSAGQSKGSGPARNFIWDHSISEGHRRHWVVDDNIRDFFRLHQNQRIRMLDGTGFRVMEDFCDRYLNLALAGPHYKMFAPRKRRHPPLTFNTRVFSCILIQNSIPFRWRCRYNEDVDLSLRALKAGYCTVEFYAFLQDKVWTQVIRGGNTDAFYAEEGTSPKSQMLVRLHPDVARLARKFGRCHHHVDMRPFKGNRLKRDPSADIPAGSKNYGLKIVPRSEIQQKASGP